MTKAPAQTPLIGLLARGPSPGPALQANHHLRLRGTVWHIAIVAYQGGRRTRIERSLKTSDVNLARQRRDDIIDNLCEGSGYVVVRGSRRGR